MDIDNLSFSARWHSLFPRDSTALVGKNDSFVSIATTLFAVAANSFYPQIIKDSVFRRASVSSKTAKAAIKLSLGFYGSHDLFKMSLRGGL